MKTFLRNRMLAAVVVWMLIAAPALAAISIEGSVTGVSTGTPAPLNVGGLTYGRVRVDGGSVLDSSTASVGGLSESVSAPGYVEVVGAGSLWRANGVTIGRSPSSLGEVEIRDGGRLIVTGPSSVGQGAFYASLSLTGQGSSAHVNSLAVGSQSAGLLQVRDGATVTAGSLTIGSRGEVMLSGGFVRASTISNSGVIRGSGTYTSQAAFSNSGSIVVGPGRR
ncbi:MAG: hypothetical protein ACRCT8_02235 [Lacipirellulaceae bacterium]